MPFYQGTLDGLCGLYALVNAYEACGIEEEETLKLVFKLACDTLPRRRWPDVLWDGTSFQEMKKMICRCEEAMGNGGDSPIIAEFPFEGNDPGSNDQYWAYFDRAFSYEDVVCGIVGLEKPSNHWIVIERGSKKHIWFTDSDGDDDLVYRMNVSSLHAGPRRRDKTQWRLNREELIIFKLIGA